MWRDFNPGSLCLAAIIGALVSVVFFRVKIPGTNHLSRFQLFAAVTGYALLAGYIAVCIVGVSQPYQAFLVGAGLDALLRNVREKAASWVNDQKQAQE